MDADPIQVLLRVCATLEGLGIDYVVGGSVASSLLGEVRYTADIDLVADFPTDRVEAFLDALQPEFYVFRDAVRAAVRSHGSFNVIHQELQIKVDVFAAEGSIFGPHQLRRRSRMTVSEETGAGVYVSSPEDIVLVKLDGYRKGGGVSDRQWRDILGVLKVRGDSIDKAYMICLAAEASLTGLLDRALREAGLSGPPGSP
ncbi:MAG: hypothetical protein HYY93_16355 [Planctomycetes bacterium]|nr:hypothetical protein [Planctomycetota bacterium]